MKRSRFPRRSKLAPDIEALTGLARGLGESTSLIEDRYWELRLSKQIDGLLKSGDDEALNAALDVLYSEGGPAYDRLADLVESACESRQDDPVLLLFAAPVLVWSRFTIPAGPISPEVLTSLRNHLQTQIFSEEARIGLADFMFSPDQLPQSYAETLKLTDKLGKAALHGRNHHFDPAKMAETMNFLSDIRYLVGVVCVSAGAGIFRWQEDAVSREAKAQQWRNQGGEALRPLFPACAMEALLPLPFFSACRESDRLSRPYAIKAAVALLQTTLNIESTQLRAVVAPFFDRQLEEYRIGFTLDKSSEVVHGVVWPLLEVENEASEIPAQIEVVLRESGLKEIVLLDHRFPLEFCDDCGAPLYPNPDGEPVHAEMPEGPAESAPQHLH